MEARRPVSSTLGRRAWIALAAIAAAALAVANRLGDDYANLGCHLSAPRCDEPAYPIAALAHGQFATFVDEQPLMGPVSLVLRAPFARLANVFEAGLTWHYRITLFPCLFVTALLAIVLWRESRARGHNRFHAAAVGTLAFVNPLVLSATNAGHPEELVAAAAVVASALLVLRGRATAAAIVLALALATKAWAVLAVVPILLAVPAPRRARFATVAAVVLVAAYAPLVAGDPGRFHTVVTTAGSLGSQYGEATAPNAWFFTARAGDFTFATEVVGGQIQFGDATGYAVSVGVARLAHALVLLLAVGLALVWWRSGGAERPESLLLVLGAILLLRCVADPGNHLYYHAAAALALLGYDALRPRARVPWLAVGFISALFIIDRVNAHLTSDTAFAIVYLAWAVPTLAGLAFLACRRSGSIPPTGQSPISPRPVMGSLPG